jgi:hypothetical protein
MKIQRFSLASARFAAGFTAANGLLMTAAGIMSPTARELGALMKGPVFLAVGLLILAFVTRRRPRC